jgi:hypothetical protein
VLLLPQAGGKVSLAMAHQMAAAREAGGGAFGDDALATSEGVMQLKAQHEALQHTVEGLVSKRPPPPSSVSCRVVSCLVRLATDLRLTCDWLAIIAQEKEVEKWKGKAASYAAEQEDVPESVMAWRQVSDRVPLLALPCLALPCLALPCLAFFLP